MDIALKPYASGNNNRYAGASALWSGIVALLMMGPFLATAQAQNYLASTGIPSFTAPYPAEMGVVDAASGNLHLEIPLGSFPQRGGSTVNLRLAYDSNMWSVNSADGISPIWADWQDETAFSLGQAWRLVVPSSSGGTYESNSTCVFDYHAFDPNGTQHWFHINLGTGTLASGCSINSISTYAADSCGISVTATWVSSDVVAIQEYASDGTCLQGSCNGHDIGGPPEDTNGNYMVTANDLIGTPPNYESQVSVTDTLGRQFLSNSTGTSCTFASTSGLFYPMCLLVTTSESSQSLYTVTYADIPLNTDFGISGVTECTTAANCMATVITSITLPDTTQYIFKYDCYEAGNTACNSPSGQSGYYGTLTSMTLPTGSEIYYGYSTFTDELGNRSRWLTTKSGGSGSWSYTPTATTAGSTLITQVTVDKPDNSNEVLSFEVGTQQGSVNAPLNGAWLTQVLSYDTDGATLLSTVNNTWDFSVACTLNLCEGYGPQDVRKLSTSTTVPIPGGSITEQTKYTYDTPQTGNVTGIEEWKYQSGTSPTFSSVPDRGTYTTYATIGSNNDISRPASITVCNNVGTNANCTGGGTPVAQTTITYDAYGSNGSSALQSVTGAVNHDDANFGTSYTARGNATQISKLISGTSVLTTAISYDTTGQVIKVVDSDLNATTYSYLDVFYDDNGSDPPAAHSVAQKTNAYVTAVTDAIGSTSNGYYWGSGQTALSTDYNGVTTYGHYVDPFGRPTKTDYPIGWLLNVYGVPAGGQTEIDSYVAVGDTGSTGFASCTLCTHTQALLDGLGRAVTGNLVNNPAGEVAVASVYDGMNRINSQSHPYIGTSDPNDVYENGYFDGLGRFLATQHPDGEIVRTAYGARAANLGGLTSQQSSASSYGYGFPAVSMDEAGKQRQEWIDGFGHVIEVDEPSSNAATRATATITVTGSEGSKQVCVPPNNPELCHTQYDSGYLTVTVNGFAVTAYWGKGSTAVSVAQSLAGGLNSYESPVTATLNGTGITMTAGGPGAYTISFQESFQYNDFQFTPTSGTLSGGTGGIISSPNVTTYTYDVLGNLTSVTQGAQSRSYQYDGLSRLTQEITPEAGKITLSYGLPGSLCSGNPSNPCSRTAPAPNQTGSSTVSTTYTYNTANQLTQKTHSDTTGTETYGYGTSASSYNIGRLITMTDPSGSETYAYDKIGRVTQVAKTIGSTSYTMQYAYNSGDELTSVTYPSGRVIAYNYDNVGHLCQVATSLNSQCNATSPYLALPSSSYDAAGRPLSATYGNGVVATAAYSPQTFELTSLGYAKGTNTLLGLNYYYQQNATYCPAGNAVGNDGQIQCIADVSAGTGDSGRSAAYTYDSLGRLLTANTTGSTKYPTWGLSWTYDRYANRTAQTVTAGSGYNVSLSINTTNNQITGYTYDASGNITAFPSNAATFAYDAEECNAGYTGSASAATYMCDGNHLRVKKVVTGSGAVTTVSIRSGGQVIAEYDNGAAVTSPTREYLYGNNLLAIVTGSTGGSGGTIIYQHRDHLSPRLYTDVNGNCVGDQGSYPFGELWYSNNDTNCTNNTSTSWIFTSYERDQESGNDYALARSYANSQGRFLTPDPLEGVVGDPQSWNRYAYVENDPINLSDPSGQGFWSDLLGALEDLFMAFATQGTFNASYFGQDGSLPDISACTYPCLQSISLPKINGSARVMAPPCPPFANCSGSTENNGPGSPGNGAPDPASTSNYPDGFPESQGPTNGGATTTASGPNPTPGGGTISNPSGGSIWDECGASTGCMTTLAGFSNFFAGAGDALTGGLTALARKGVSAVGGYGYGENINYRSWAYRGGEVTGTAVGVALSGPKGPVFGTGGRGLLNSIKSLRFGWSYMEAEDFYRFRIGGTALKPLVQWGILESPHINIWPLFMRF
jgi:RHS repeat-associated protein